MMIRKSRVFLAVLLIAECTSRIVTQQTSNIDTDAGPARYYAQLTLEHAGSVSHGDLGTLRGRVGFEQTEGGGYADHQSVRQESYFLFPDRWTFGAVRVGNGRVTVFQDLAEIVDKAFEGVAVVLDPSRDFSIGSAIPDFVAVPNGDHDDRAIDGLVHSAHMFDHALSAVEMRRLYFGYRFNDVAADGVVDSLSVPSLVSIPGWVRNFFSTEGRAETSAVRSSFVLKKLP